MPAVVGRDRADDGAACFDDRFAGGSDDAVSRRGGGDRERAGGVAFFKDGGNDMVTVDVAETVFRYRADGNVVDEDVFDVTAFVRG